MTKIRFVCAGPSYNEWERLVNTESAIPRVGEMVHIRNLDDARVSRYVVKQVTHVYDDPCYTDEYNVLSSEVIIVLDLK